MIQILFPSCVSGPVRLTLCAPCPRRTSPDLWMTALWSAQSEVIGLLGARCHAASVLPGRLQAVWTLRTPARIAELQAAFAAALLPGSQAGQADRGRIRLRLRPILRPGDMARLVDDCHFAPVRYGWCREPGDWPHSTQPGRTASEMILT